VTGVAVGLAVLAAAIAWLSYVRWKGNEIAMRHSAPLPGSIGIPVLAFALAAVAIVLAIGLLFHRP
jgi:putative membrane protein